MGPIKIGGDVIGGSATEAGAIQANTKGSTLTIGGSLMGGTASSTASIRSLVAGGYTSVTVMGDIVGGSAVNSGLINASGPLGKVAVVGSLIGSTATSTGIISSQLSLGSVKIEGNVEGGSGSQSGRITGASITSIAIGGSLIGGSNMSTGELFSDGPIGPVKIIGNVIGGSITGGALNRSGYIQGQTIASLFIGGSVIAGVDQSGAGDLTKNASIRAANDIGPTTIRGSLIGNTGSGGETRVIISALGQATPGATTDIAIKKLTIGGRAEFASITAGYDVNLAALNPDAQIGAVSVAGDWMQSDLAAGALATNGSFGDDNDAVIPAAGEPDAIFSRIASITIKGSVLGTVGGADHFGFVAQEIGKFKAGGITYALTPKAGNDDLDANDPLLVVASTGDVRVHELAI